MIQPDENTIKIFYTQALFDFLGAIDQMSDLFDPKKIPHESDKVFAETRFRKCHEKLETVIKIAKMKYGYNLGEMPIYVRIVGRS